MSFKRSILAVFTVAVCAACGDDPMGVDPDPDPDPDPRVELANPAFAANIQEIFERTGCTAAGCHGAGAGGLTLVASNASANHTTLVNMQANGEAIDYVIPTNANDSYLVVKLENRQSVGQRMPRGGPALDAIDLANIKNWINTGAPNN